MGLNEYGDVCSMVPPKKALDLGCGIGRHVIYSYEMGFDAYGIDLSETAIGFAVDWFKQRGGSDPQSRIKQGDITNLPFSDDYFDVIISHGVLDSVPFSVAQNAMSEAARVMKKDGLFYLDLISGDDSAHAREYAGEQIVEAEHEKGTIQSYFNFAKINCLVDGYFELVECILIRREDVISGFYTSRWHIVLKK